MLKDYLHVRRREQGLTQAELAKRSGLSPQTVSNMEKLQVVKGQPREMEQKFSNLMKVAKGLGVPAIDILKHAKGYEMINELVQQVCQYDQYQLEGWYEMLDTNQKKVVRIFAEFLHSKGLN